MMAMAGVDPVVAAIIQDEVNTGRFSATSKVRVIEASPPDYICEELEFDDESLSQKLEIIRDETTSTAVKMRNFFIPWAVHDKRLAITSDSFLKICTAIRVPALFIEGLLDYNYWVRPGNALFFSRDEKGGHSKLDLFYRCPSSEGGRAYIFTTYDFAKKLTTNICFNIHPAQTIVGEKSGIRPAGTFCEAPLSMHILLASQILQNFNREASNLRVRLLQDENGQFSADPKAKTENLHRLAQQLHIAVANFTDFEEMMKFIIKASERISHAINPTQAAGTTSEADMLLYLLSKVQFSKRWISNYRDRANIRINLAFHLSTQVDNDINLQISKATSAIARDAQRDSSSMITIAAVTMFFLPGTFISAVFSMTFFNFEQDSTGDQQFQVSEKWWYFLAATIPLTIVVFLVWIAWQKWRFRSLAKEDKSFGFLR